MSLEQKFNVDETRGLFGKRLGEIIEGVIGDARVRELFDAAGKHPDEYEGKPTGMIALDLGVITPDTKTALLVAQAAERTLQLADKAQSLPHLGLKDGKSIQAYSQDNAVAFADPVFKFVGSPRDPEILQQAQATWKIAQMNLNEEIEAFDDAVFSNSKPYINDGHVNGLKKAAAELYGVAAQMLKAEGHTEASEKLQAVSGSVSYDAAYAPAPSQIATSLISNIKREVQERNIMLGDEKWVVPKEYTDELIRLSKLTEPKEMLAPTAGSKPSFDAK